LLKDFERLGQEPAVVRRHGLRIERTSYGELARLAGCYARELESRGITKGQRVAIWGSNGSEWIGSFFGCTLRANIDETESAAIITERGGQENHRERSQNGSSFCSQFA
jgi:long-subunit acyl-CoA synthetase (AMP-forming)